MRCLAFCNLAEKPEADGMEGVPYRSTMNKKIDKAALAARILGLEGISSEDKSALLELLSERSYGLYWENSPEEVEALLREKLPVLTEDTTKRILADATDEVPNHILIEGDNYPALVALQYAYEGKVDVIYIDPPYNTGNKDFVYNDSYVDCEDSYRHSKWLSFMSKRLRIAKRLLSDRGVIFISIDDNEQANLKLLCDEVFGSSNFLANIIWEKKYTVANDAKYFSDNHDFIVCYAKSKDNFHIGQLPRSEEMNAAYKNPDNHPKGPWKATPLHARSGSESSANFSFTFSNGVVFTPPIGRFSAYSAETLQKFDENNEIWFGVNGKSTPSRKTFLCDLKKTGVVPRTLIHFEEGGHNHEADEEIKSILGSKFFTSPKPSKLIKLLLTIANLDSNSIVLDFFAGSGTTLHATMQLNAEDGGHRQCILVTNNENNICEEVTYERNKRVIQGYTTPKGQQVEGLKNNNLRYYKVDFVDREKTAANQKELMKASTDLLCIKENLYQEETCFEGLKLHEQIARCFSDGTEGGKKMLIIYEPAAIPVIVKRIEQMTVGKENKLKVYVMAEGQYPYTEDFESVLSKVELRAMPHALYQAMRQVLPPPAEAENNEPDMEVGDEEADGSIYKSEEL